MFPGAPDRGKVLNRAGRRLAAAGKSAAALEMFASVARDRNLPDADRLEAAADAVAAAERLTGRDPAECLRKRADYITEMAACRHPFEQGKPARPGIEW